MTRIVFDPHRKRERDHKKIVADKKRDEEIASDVREFYAKNPYKPAEKRIGSWGFRFSRYVAKPIQNTITSKKGKRKRKSEGSAATSRGKEVQGASRHRQTGSESELRKMILQSLHEVTLSEIVELDERLDVIGKEIDAACHSGRKEMLGERRAHLKRRKEGLIARLNRIMGSV